jgi:hypothetical protein
MTKIDALIEKFKEFKEELNKNMNGPMNPGMHKPNATTGTSGGQTGMYRSEDGMNKDAQGAGGAQDMMQMSEETLKFDKNGQWSLGKSAFKTLQHKIERQGHSPESAAAITASIGRKEVGQKEMTARSKAALNKVDPEENINIPHPQGKATMANGVNKDDTHLATDGKNREANPKLHQSDLGPGGKVHMVQIKKDEGTNEEANPTHPHNKGKFKVMDEVKEKEEKHAGANGLPYSGKDKDVHKGEECSKCHSDPCKCVDKSQMGHIQGNEAKGNDENKAPGRGQLGV